MNAATNKNFSGYIPEAMCYSCREMTREYKYVQPPGDPFSRVPNCIRCIAEKAFFEYCTSCNKKIYDQTEIYISKFTNSKLLCNLCKITEQKINIIDVFQLDCYKCGQATEKYSFIQIDKNEQFDWVPYCISCLVKQKFGDQCSKCELKVTVGNKIYLSEVNSANKLCSSCKAYEERQIVELKNNTLRYNPNLFKGTK